MSWGGHRTLSRFGSLSSIWTMRLAMNSATLAVNPSNSALRASLTSSPLMILGGTMAWPGPNLVPSGASLWRGYFEVIALFMRDSSSARFDRTVRRPNAVSAWPYWLRWYCVCSRRIMGLPDGATPKTARPELTRLLRCG